MSVKHKLYGAILGDLAGQPYEFPPKGTVGAPSTEGINIHNPDSKITDDTVMTLATAHYIIDDMKGDVNTYYSSYYNKYSNCGYGESFEAWAKYYGTIAQYTNNSWGNGCLMRISPFMYIDPKLQLVEIIKSVMKSHCSEESILSVIKLHNGYKGVVSSNDENKVNRFDKFEVRASITVDFCLFMSGYLMPTTNLIKTVISRGGDTDTNASIVGELSNYQKDDLSERDVEYVRSKLDKHQLEILDEFNKKFK